jgi:single-strand DNA-binding protein
MNEITIHGNLTDEPALHHSPSGVAVAKFTVAVNSRRFNRPTNRWVDRNPVFHQVVAFNGLATNAAATLAKGMTVTVTGELADDSWRTEEGRKIRRSQLEATDIAVSLRYATAQVTKIRREQPAEADDTPVVEPVD